MPEGVGERKFFQIGVVYHSGKNPPRDGAVPEGYQWVSIKGRGGKTIGYQLEQPLDPEGPPNFTDEDRQNTLSEPPRQGVLSRDIMEKAEVSWNGATKGVKENE